MPNILDDFLAAVLEADGPGELQRICQALSGAKFGATTPIIEPTADREITESIATAWGR